ncbi:MAG TPA: VOC family protein [Polyangiales bacterium]|nr:VOC family protein [Polyangiales bacterium]
MTSKNIFVNFPVKDLKRSMTFFSKLGYEFKSQFTDDTAACMVIGENIFSMLLTEEKFKTFAPKAITDTKKSNEMAVGLSLESRAEVTRMVETALANGARRYAEPNDYGFMYQWGFEDLDGHIWEYMWMDPAHVQK